MDLGKPLDLHIRSPQDAKVMMSEIAFTIPALPLGEMALGPFPVRWYALSYLAGFLLGWVYILYLIKPYAGRPDKRDIEDFVTWIILGVILGGRLGYVLFYASGQYIHDPLGVFRIWEGGMSFHGALIGVAVVIFTFAYRREISPWRLADLVACAAPIGLFLGRLGNFINGELWGRTTDVPWSMVFAGDPLQLSRHPSQLYQAGLEGILLFLTLAVIWHRTDYKHRPGMISGCFLIGYGLARMTGELFRMPDRQLGFVIGDLVTMGQMLSLPMILLGGWLIWRALRRPAIPMPQNADGARPAA